MTPCCQGLFDLWTAMGKPLLKKRMHLEPLQVKMLLAVAAHG